MINFFWQSHRPILYLKRQQKVHPAKRFENLRSRQHGLLCTETCFYSCQNPTLKLPLSINENCDCNHPDENYADLEFDCLHILYFGCKGPTRYEKVQNLEKVHTLDQSFEVLA